MKDDIKLDRNTDLLLIHFSSHSTSPLCYHDSYDMKLNLIRISDDNSIDLLLNSMVI